MRRPVGENTSASAAWMDSVFSALEDVRQLAEDMLPGATARLMSPQAEDRLARIAIDTDQPAVDGADGAAVALRLDDDVVVAVLGVQFPGPPPPDTADRLVRLARVARFSPAVADDTEVRRTALISVVRSIPLRVMFLDHDLRILAASPQSADDIAMPEADFLGQQIHRLRPEVFARFQSAFERGLRGETVRTPRLRSQIGDGPVLWFRTEIHPWRDSDGRIAGIIVVAIDITDMVEALVSVERSEERLKVALEIADVHVWEIDYVSRTTIKAGAESTFFDGSISDREMIRDTNITIHPEDRPRIQDAWAEAMAKDLPFRPEYRINRADGKEVWAAGTTKLIRDHEGQPQRLIGAMQNITARKQAEAELVHALAAAEAANRAKSVFLATMSHEIRTPLNGVLGMAQALASDALSPVQQARVETIRQSGEGLLVILNDLLDLSKIEAGKLDLEVADFSLTPLVQGVRAAFADVALDKGVALVLDTEEDTAGVYRGDPTRLRQILFNLVANALKFTETGEVRLSVRRDGETLAFRVIDTGIGIPADRLARLFDRFEQADASTTRRFGGAGLGLAISRDLAAMMGGVIEVESREGRGTTFSFTVTLPRVKDEAYGVSPGTGEAPFEPGGALRVLAAEDNGVNQLVLRTLLQQVGIEPVIVGDGAAAVEAWRNQLWDVILMDVQMPVMDGPTATRTIRALEAETGRARTPIIAVTANAMAHQVVEYGAAGMDSVVAKPIRVEDLFGALQAILDAADEVNESAAA